MGRRATVTTRRSRRRAATPDLDIAIGSFTHDTQASLSRLRQTLAELLTAFPGDLRRAVDIQRELKLDATLSWQVFRLAEASDPLSVAAQVPGAPSMRRFFAAIRKHVDAGLVKQAAQAFREFEAIVAVHAGDRTAFASMMGGVVDDIGSVVDFKHRRSAFRANAHLWGLQDRCGLSCQIIAPTPGGQTPSAKVEMASIRGRVGLWRYRPGPPIVLSSVGVPPHGVVSPSAIRREPLDPESYAQYGVSILPEFCSKPTPEVVMTEMPPSAVQTQLVTGAVGRTAAITYMLGDLIHGVPGPAATDEACLIIRYNVRLPSELVIHDVLVHDEVFGSPGVTPHASIRVFGDQHVGDRPPALRDPADLLHLREVTAYLGKGAAVLHTGDVPRYVEMIRWAGERLAWDLDRFHVFRCRMEYPVMPSTLEMTLRANG